MEKKIYGLTSEIKLTYRKTTKTLQEKWLVLLQS